MLIFALHQSCVDVSHEQFNLVVFDKSLQSAFLKLTRLVCQLLSDPLINTRYLTVIEAMSMFCHQERAFEMPTDSIGGFRAT